MTMMTTKIWKFQLPLSGHTDIVMPKGAKVLHVANQTETLCIWCLVPDDQINTELRRFRIVGTGHLINDKDVTLIYVGTALFAKDSLVLHVFEETGPS